MDEYITLDIARKYAERARSASGYPQDIGEVRCLKEELMELYGVTELEAFNILLGFNVGDYINKYEKLKELSEKNNEADDTDDLENFEEDEE